MILVPVKPSSVSAKDQDSTSFVNKLYLKINKGENNVSKKPGNASQRISFMSEDRKESILSVRTKVNFLSKVAFNTPMAIVLVRDKPAIELNNIRIKSVPRTFLYIVKTVKFLNNT